MLSRLWKWLFGKKEAVAFDSTTYTRRTPFVLPAGTTEDEVRDTVLFHCFQTGSFVFATRQDDGSVLVEGSGPEESPIR